MKTKVKTGKLGPGFHHYLEYLEGVEYILSNPDNVPKKVPVVAINQALFEIEESKMENLVNDLIPVDAYLASIVRSSVKYKMHTDTIMQLTTKYKDEIGYISTTTPVRLPHEWCTLIMEGFGDDTIIIVAQEQTCELKPTYKELGVGHGEPFICLNICMYKPGGSKDMSNMRQRQAKMSHIPVEIHCKIGELEKNCHSIFAGAKGIKLTPEGHRTMELVWNSFLIWIAQFELQSVLREKSVGVLPSHSLSIRRQKRRKKHDHPQFEHTVIRMEIDAPEPGQTGHSFLSAKKRMHQVRGFYRHLRSGKHVWIKPHWRGDEKLGVIRRDIELVTHPNEGEGA